MRPQTFNVCKLSTGNYSVKTNYNSYMINVNSVKGIAIYMEGTTNSGNWLIKSYRHTNILTAISYLFKKEIF